MPNRALSYSALPGRHDSSQYSFRLGEESSVGQNSRQLLADGTVYWVGPRDDFVRPTGPFDPDPPGRVRLVAGQLLGLPRRHTNGRGLLARSLTDEDGNNGNENGKPGRAVVDEAAAAGDGCAVAERYAVAPMDLGRKRVVRLRLVDLHGDDADEPVAVGGREDDDPQAVERVRLLTVGEVEFAIAGALALLLRGSGHAEGGNTVLSQGQIGGLDVHRAERLIGRREGRERGGAQHN